MDINEKYIWNLKDIFETDEKRIQYKENILKKLEEIGKYKGILKESKENIYNCYKLYEEIIEMYEKYYCYAMLLYHKDMSNTESIKTFKEAEALQTQLSSDTSFITPEITNIDEEKLREYIQSPELIRYKRILEELLEKKKYILSEKEETLLSKYNEVLNSNENIYEMLAEVEMKFPKVHDEDGNEVQLTQGMYARLVMSKNREIRKEAYYGMYETYKEYINTFTETYISKVKQDTITSKVRNYNSSLEKTVINDDSTIKVYNSLVKAVNNNLDIHHEYMKLKKELLGVDELHLYDVYVNSLEKERTDIKYEDGKKIVLEALSIMGEEYTNKLKEAFDSRWLDVFETPNKRSGGYNLGLYGVHPYILLNYKNTFEDVSTIAHELGHAMHSYYSDTNQNILDSDYTILVAEVASTVNEILLNNYMIENEPDNYKKAILINQQIDTIRSTLITQTMLAEFEKQVHEKIEKGENLSADNLNEIYYDLNKRYYGEEVYVDEIIKYGWARIPHFYTPFYVYKYATGISSAICIASKILSNEKGYIEKYINMLKQGCTKKSIDLLKMVDVDLENPQTYEEAFQFYKKGIKRIKDLIK